MDSKNKIVLIFGLTCAVMCCAYLVYLAASWNQYQVDREQRDNTINDLLDRLNPKKTDPAGPVIVVDGIGE